MIENLPVVDYERYRDAKDAIERCPTGAIVWFDPQDGARIGSAARKVVRQAARTVSPT
jgi:hypothetical protein